MSPRIKPQARVLTVRLIIFTLVGALVITSNVLAAEPKKPEPLPGDAMIEKYLAAEVARISKKELDGATTRAEWEARRPRLKQEYFEMLGLWPRVFPMRRAWLS